MFLFSSKTIPGNEVGVGRIVNAFSEMGVRVVDDSSGLYHVSGHANRPDLEEVHGIFRPKMLLPMHGEHRHLREHAELARAKGISSEIVVNGATYNGAMPPQGNLTDYEIAAAATYERTSWGNDDGIVLPADVAAVR